MGKNVSVAAALVSFAAFLILQACQVQGVQLPDWLFWAIVIFGVSMGVICSFVVLHWAFGVIRNAVFRFCSTWGLRWPWPLYRKDRPSPLQWLVDLAQEQVQNPAKYLVPTDRVVLNFDRDALRPYLRVRTFYQYLGLHSLVVGQPEGFPTFLGEQLPDKIEDQGGKTNIDPGGEAIVDLDVFIPDKFLKAVCDEYDSGAIRSLELYGLKAKIAVKARDGSGDLNRWWNLGAPRPSFRLNR